MNRQICCKKTLTGCFFLCNTLKIKEFGRRITKLLLREGKSLGYERNEAIGKSLRELRVFQNEDVRELLEIRKAERGI